MENVVKMTSITLVNGCKKMGNTRIEIVQLPEEYTHALVSFPFSYLSIINNGDTSGWSHKLTSSRAMSTLTNILSSLKAIIDEDFSCPICLEPCTDTLINPECGHRFCGKCIKENISKCNNNCPACRVHIPTHRSCRKNSHFDHIVSQYDERIFVLTPHHPRVRYFQIHTPI